MSRDSHYCRECMGRCELVNAAYEEGRQAGIEGRGVEDSIRSLFYDADGGVVCVNDPDAGARVEIRFSELEDAQRLHKRIVEARAITSTAGSERCAECLLCGHAGSVDVLGVCGAVIPVSGLPRRDRYCGCKCVFPAPPEAEDESKKPVRDDLLQPVSNNPKPWRLRLYDRADGIKGH